MILPAVVHALAAFAGPMQESAPAVSVGVSAEKLGKIDAVVEAAIARGDAPGAVVLVGRHGKVVFEKAYGLRAVEPAKEPMTLDTVFDWASLTKVVATTPCIMALVEDGKVALGDSLAKHLPGFECAGEWDNELTIESCLLHMAGFPADDPLSLYSGAPDEIFARKSQRKIARRPWDAFVYSDVGFEWLGRLVEKLSGKPLDVYSKERILDPLGMNGAGFRRIGAAGLPPNTKIAPTEREEGEWLRGVVHDPRARALGGVAGHAGLFGTARDLAKYGFAVLAADPALLRAESIVRMASVRGVEGPGRNTTYRGLGWDVASAYSAPRGDVYRFGSFGHTGFTGTSIWLDPHTDSLVIVLTSALHPDGKGDVRTLRGQVATAAAAAIQGSDTKDGSPWYDEDLVGGLHARTPSGVQHGAMRQVTWSVVSAADSGTSSLPSGAAGGAPGVLAGVDVLEKLSFAPIANKTVGLLTNQTGFTRSGIPTIDLLLSRKAKEAGVRLVTLFSPEHGIRGDLDATIGSGLDTRTGLPIVSLYREASRRPLLRDLFKLDVLVVDLQDVGCRFYTYLATLGYCLEECAKAGVEIVVLDRPDPIGADRFEGPLLDEGKSTFVGYHRMPIRTGMTMGECARMFNEERKIGAALSVVLLEGYKRELWYEETGLPFIHTSPNIRNVDAAALYPGLCLLEYGNISVGRGTPIPFEWFGAPWMVSERIAAALNARAIPGVRFEAMDQKPPGDPGYLWHGARIVITDRKALRPVRLGFEIACAVRDIYPTYWERARFGELLGSASTLALFEHHESADAIEASWNAGLAEFEARRARFLLYGDPNKKPK